MHIAPLNVPAWTPYTAYPPGSRAFYAGSVWRCDIPHTSGADPMGAPTSNLNLWTPISSSSSGSSTPSYDSPDFAPPPYLSSNDGAGSSAPPVPYASRPDEKDGRSSAGSSGTVVPEKADHGGSPSSGPSEKGDRGLFQSDAYDRIKGQATDALRAVTLREEGLRATSKDELKDELKGKRVWRVGGLGVWAWSEDDKAENDKQGVWRKWGDKHGKAEWLSAARARTAFYKDTRGIVPIVRWKLVERGGRMPDDALPVGHEANGEVLYAARAWHEGGLHLGKAGAHLVNSASISYGGAELTLDVYEVLCGPPDSSVLTWLPFDHGFRATLRGWQPVEGGRERDGQALFVAKAEHERGIHPGKCLVNDDHACVGYGGGELWVRPFYVLAYATADRR
ncbi:hypothetical protein Q5752_002212 [Cryptotrichosporon argae]